MPTAIGDLDFLSYHRANLASEKAKACLSLMGDFIRDATALCQSLSKQAAR
ncbi:hypothetical protein RBH92_00475 [Nitrosomonas sp. sh817]|nr:hypothetical protein RBH92_00475 [Nitrosomonas sp. sh817]